MRARFLLSGIAVAAFAATLAALAPQVTSRAVQTPAATSTAPIVAVPVAAAASRLQDAPAQARDETSIEDAQPPAPDPSALPSYESDQAARNANPLRSARTR
jgi:hypothetical protein